MGIIDRDYYHDRNAKTIKELRAQRLLRNMPSSHKTQPPDLDVVFWLFALGAIAGTGFIAWLIYRLAKALL